MVSFGAFDAVATELMMKNGVTVAKLLKRLHDIRKTVSKDLPPVQVLYCASHGEFGYSDEFHTFERTFRSDLVPNSLTLESESDLDHVSRPLRHRVSDAKLMPYFGQHVMDKWPKIAKLVNVYMRNDLGSLMKEITEIASKETRLLDIPRIRDKIAAQKATRNGTVQWHDYDLRRDKDYTEFAPSALKKMLMRLDDEESELLIAVKAERDALLLDITKVQYDAMYQSLGRKFPGEKMETPKRFSFSSFTDAISHHGENHYAVWQHQRYFNESTMRFLLLHPEHAERLVTEGEIVDCRYELGICAASTRSSFLKTANMPRFSEWTVSEYDGLESVHLLGDKPDFYRRMFSGMF